jgi:hypothetical protein
MNQASKIEPYDSREYLTCPFCSNQCIEPRQGETRCPVCDVAFEIDDRVECVFADTDDVRLPIYGIVCGSCGLVQSGDRKSCPYCEIGINAAVH